MKPPVLISIITFVILFALHQDSWNWGNTTLVFGFLPIGLFWHALISLGATLTWFLATKIAWPFHGSPNANESAATDRGGK